MILVTGAAGFIGSHLCDFLVARGLDVCGTYWKGDTDANIKHLKDRVDFVECDFKDKQSVLELVRKTRPDTVFHLAAQSFVIPSWKDPEETIRTNILGTLYLFDAIRSEGLDPKILVACSSSEYGLSYENEIPINEKKEFRPSSPYAVSKVGEDMLSYLFCHAYKMKVIRIRYFNITGPRKILDAYSDFAKGIVEIEKGLSTKLSVGNLDGIRDITDINDALNATWMLTEKGRLGEVYNICSGRGHKVSDILNRMISLSNKKITVIEDKNKLRKLDDPIFIGDNSKIAQLGWKPSVPIEKTLSGILAYWRNTLK